MAEDLFAPVGPLNRKDFPGMFPRVLPPGWKRIEESYDGVAYAYVGGLVVMSSVSMEQDGQRWLHVSMSRRSRMPSYEDMALVKQMFIGDDKYALQVFPPKSKHVNIHSFCLHLWHCIDREVTPDFTQGGNSI